MPRPGHTPPEYLNGIFTKLEYNAMLREKAGGLLEKDRTRKRPWVKGTTFSMYERLIHDAICAGGQYDPFTGERLQWDRISTWVNTKSTDIMEKYKDFALLPTVDHVDPDGTALQFEICGLLVNTCKSSFTPDEFLAICASVAAYCSAKN